MRLNTSTQSVQIFSDASATTVEPTFSAVYSNIFGAPPTLTGASALSAYGTTTGTTPVEVVPAPPTNAATQITEIIISNEDSVDHDITVQVLDGSSVFIPVVLSIPTLKIARYSDDIGWTIDVDGSGTGSVTSVDLTAPAEFTVSGTPITTSGTIILDKADESANTVWAGPTTGVPAQPSFRTLVSADMPGSGPGSGTVTSVALSLPATFSVVGSPVTSSGTLTASYVNQSANTFFSGPTSGGASTPAFRTIVTADIPNTTITYAKIQDETDNTLLGRSAGSAGAPMEIAIGSGLSLSSGTLTSTGSGGTVTSVALTMPSIFSVAGSPVTTSGTLAVTLATETANTVFAGPTSGGAAAPTFRTIVAADLPGSFSGFANPSGLIGLTAANGVATTAERSDATHALDQGIVPTWTGAHTFNSQLFLANGSVSAPELVFNTNYGFWYDPSNFLQASSTAVVLNQNGLQDYTFARSSTGSANFYVTSNANSANNTVWSFATGVNANLGQYNIRRSHGGYAAPVFPIQNDFIGDIRWSISNVTNTVNSIALRGICIDPTPSSTAGAGRLVGLCTPVSSTTLTEVFRFDSATGQTNTMTDAATNTVTDQLGLIHTSSGTAAAGFGSAWTVTLKNASATNKLASRVSVLWTDATNASEDADWSLNLIGAGTVAEQFRVTSTGNVYGKNLHNNSVSPTGTTNQYLASGTYTPTLTNSVNVAASTAFACQWMRVGNVVTVSGKANVDPTAIGDTQLGISLPLASNLTADQQCSGTAASKGISGQSAAILGDATNDRAVMEWNTIDITAQDMFFTFTYVVL